MHRTRRHGLAATLVAATITSALLTGCSASSTTSTESSAAAANLEGLAERPTTQQPTVDGWPVASPAALGLKGGRLDRLAKQAKRANSTCYAVVRRGKLAGEWNWQKQSRETPREVFSVTKSVTSALVGIALRRGDLRLDDPVADYVPAWRGTPSAGVTIRHLLSNDSGRFWSSSSDYGSLVQSRNRTAYAVGLSQQYEPGATWAYNNAAIQVLDAVLAEATGMRTDKFAAQHLFKPLGMSRTRLTRDASGRSTNVFFGMQTTCLDLARFGQLYLQQGTFEGRRILARDFVQDSIGRSSTSHNAAYGYLWWLNRPGIVRGALDDIDAAGQPLDPFQGQTMPGAPNHLYAASGLGGQTLLVDRRTRTLVVRLGVLSDKAPDYRFTDAAKVITSALR